MQVKEGGLSVIGCFLEVVGSLLLAYIVIHISILLFIIMGSLVLIYMLADFIKESFDNLLNYIKGTGRKKK